MTQDARTQPGNLSQMYAMKNSFFEHYADLMAYSDISLMGSGLGLGEMAYCILSRSFHTALGNGPGVGHIACQTIFVPFQVTMKVYNLLSECIPCTPLQTLHVML